VAAKLRTWGIDDAYPDIELLTSELVTNAIRHSEGAVELSIEHPSADCVRIEVRDLSERLPVMRPLETAREGGWGLHIVGHIATRWGLEQRTGVAYRVGRELGRDNFCLAVEIRLAPRVEHRPHERADIVGRGGRRDEDA